MDYESIAKKILQRVVPGTLYDETAFYIKR